MELVENQSIFDFKIFRYFAIVVLSGLFIGVFFEHKETLESGVVEDEFLFFLLFFGVFLGILFSIRMRTQINREGVTVSIFPYLFKNKYLWSDITKFSVREVSSYENFAFRRFILVPSDSYFWKNYYTCLELFREDGKEILIGTRKPEEVRKFIRSLNLEKVKESPLR